MLNDTNFEIESCTDSYIIDEEQEVRPDYGNFLKLDNIIDLENVCKKYPVLSKIKERKMIEENKHDRKKLNKLLILHNLYIVFNIAKKYYYLINARREFRDVIQDGIYGLAEAARRFDINRDIKFITFAYSWVFKEIVKENYLRSNKIDSKSIYMSGLSSTERESSDDNTMPSSNKCDSIIDRLRDKAIPYKYIDETGYEDIINEDRKDLCRYLMDYLKTDKTITEKEYEIFNKMVYSGGIPADLSSEYNISKRCVYDIRRRCLARLRRRVKDMDILSMSDV